MIRFARHLIADVARTGLAPLAAAVMPGRWAVRWLAWWSRRDWVFPEHDAVARALPRYAAERELRARRYQHEILFEAMTAWRLLLGRDPRIAVHGEWPRARPLVVVGGHYGNGIAVLWSLARAGLRPRFVMRPPAAAWLRDRPVHYLWSRLRLHLVQRLCGGRAITTGGARRRIAAALAADEGTPVVLLDTPADRATGWVLRLGGLRLELSTGARDVAAECGAEAALFTALPRRDTPLTDLRIESLGRADHLGDAFPRRFAARFDERPEAWHLWPSMAPHADPARRPGQS